MLSVVYLIGLCWVPAVAMKMVRGFQVSVFKTAETDWDEQENTSEGRAWADTAAADMAKRTSAKKAD